MLAAAGNDAATGLNVAELIGAVAAGLLIAQSLWVAIRVTIGRSFILRRRLRRLGPGAQVGFFTSTMGVSPAISRTTEYRATEYVDTEFANSEDVVNEFEPELEKQFVWVKRFGRELFWVFPEAYVQVIADADDTVLVFAVTARTKWFRPRFRVPLHVTTLDRLKSIVRYDERGFRSLLRLRRDDLKPMLNVKLNKSTFADALPPLDPDEDPEYVMEPFRAETGARTWRFADSYYLGNPGYYCNYVLSASSAVESWTLDWEGLGAAQAGLVEDSWPASRRDALARFRQKTRVSTFAVVGPHGNPEDFGSPFGPHGDEVRLLS